MKRILKNLAIAVVVVPSVWLLTLWLLARIVEGPQGENRWPEASLFYFLVLAPQVLLGSALHQAILNVLPRRSRPAALRAIGFATSIVIPLVLLVLGGEAAVLFSPGNLACMGLGLVAYSLLMELPPTRLGRMEAPRHAAAEGEAGPV
jgi:hypothetical protein